MAERWTGWKKSLMNNTAGDLALLNLKTASSSIRGAASLLLAMLIFSLQDIAVKWIGGDYPVLEIVVFRSLIALPCTFIFLLDLRPVRPGTIASPCFRGSNSFFVFLVSFPVQNIQSAGQSQ